MLNCSVECLYIYYTYTIHILYIYYTYTIHTLLHNLESIKTHELTNIIVDKFECYFQVMKLETEETWTLETAGQILLESY